MGNVKLNANNLDRSIEQVPLPADTIPQILPEEDQMYQTSINLGYLRQPIPNNEQFDPILGFPANNPNLYHGAKMITSLSSWNITAGRRTNVLMNPGIVIGTTIGTTSAFQDRCFFDALQIRGRKIGTTYTGVLIPPELDRCNCKLHIHIEGDWIATNGNNLITTYVDHYRGGVFLRRYDIWNEERQNNTPFTRVVSSASRFIVGQSTTLNEDIAAGDEFTWNVENSAGSTNDFNLILIQGHIEALPPT